MSQTLEARDTSYCLARLHRQIFTRLPSRRGIKVDLVPRCHERLPIQIDKTQELRGGRSFSDGLEMTSPIHQTFEALVPRQSTPALEIPLHTRGPTNAPRILAIVGFLTGLSALLVVLRHYARLFILRRYDIEDGIILIAQVGCGLQPVCDEQY